MEAVQICYCILILSGAFALISLGFLFIQSSSTLKEGIQIMQMLETTINKLDRILDDVDEKMNMLNAPVELINGFFSKGSMGVGLFSGLKVFSSLFKKNKKEKKK